MPRQTLLSPGSITGFMSARSPMALPKGNVWFLFDGRLEDGTARVRWGSIALGNLPSGAYRGSYEARQNGTQKLFYASYGTEVRVYESSNEGSSWSEITGVGTRLVDGAVYFALVSQGGTDYLIIQNGIDDPRVWDGTTMGVAAQTTLKPRGRVDAIFPDSTEFSGTLTFTNSDPDFEASAVDYNQIQAVQVRATTNVAVPDTAIVTGFPSFTVDATADDTAQWVWLVKSTDQEWRRLKIEVATTSTGPWTTVYDPNTTPVVAIETNVADVTFVGAPTLSDVAGMTIGAIRFDYIGDSPTGNETSVFIMMGAGGSIPGTTNVASAFRNPSAQVIGPATYFDVGPAPYSGVEIPLSPLFGYEYIFRLRTASGVPANYTRLSTYAQYPGQTGYYRIDDRAIVAANPWTFYLGGTWPMPSQDLSMPIPYVGGVSLPKGTAMENANGRLFVADGDRLWYSYAGMPFAFTQTVEFDGLTPKPDSGGSYTKPGETFTAIVAAGQLLGGSPVGSPQYGVQDLFTITDRTTYASSGYDAASLNRTVAVAVGTRSPFSVARGNGCFYMLDSERQIRRTQGTNSVTLSKETVDDQTKGIPESRIPWVAGGFTDEIFYLGYTPSGETSNILMLRYVEGRGFDCIDRPLAAANAILPYRSSTVNRTRLLLFNPTELVEHDAPGALDDDGSPIVMRIDFPEINNGTGKVQAGGSYFVTDVDSSGTIAYTISPTSGTRTSPIPSAPKSIAPQSTGASRAAVRTQTGLGADTLTFIPSIELSAKGGTRLYYAEFDINRSNDGAKQ